MEGFLFLMIVVLGLWFWWELWYVHRQMFEPLDYRLEVLEKVCPPSVELLAGKLELSTQDAMCFDLFAEEDVNIFAGEQKLVRTGVVTEMSGCDALIFSRSGLAAKRITHRAGVIDSKYPKEWLVVLANEGNSSFQIRKGDKIAQVLFVPKFNIDYIENGGKIVFSDRVRTDGFGSTSTGEK